MNNPHSRGTIAIVHDTIYPYTKGGGQKRFYALGKALAEEGYDVHLYGMKAWEGEDVVRREGLTLHGICASYPLYTSSGRRSISQALRFGLATFRLWKEPFDVMDCCGFPYFSLFPARLLTWLRRKPLYSTWHEVWGYAYWKRYLGRLGPCGFLVEWLAARLPDTILAVSDSTKEALARKLGRRRNVRLLLTGIEADKIGRLPSAAEGSDVIFAGRLLAYKNVDLLIRAVALLVREDPALTLAIVGEGPEKPRLERLARDQGVEDNVRFLGFLEEEEELYARIAAAKVFVLPSEREGFGIVVIEANACGTPVVTVDHPQNAARHLIRQGENGAVVPLEPEALAGAIRRTMARKEAKDYYRSYIRAYDWKMLVKDYERVFFSR
jgi:glycosyltransferase involved in cell wall biosynthesis